MNVSVSIEDQQSTYHHAFVNAIIKNLVVVLLGIAINYINASMVHTFHKEEALKTNPRYVLFIHLVINDMIQLCVAISLFVFTYTFFTINVSACCLLIMAAVFTTQNTPLNLAAMALECYVAVCLPLRHAHLCTVRRAHTAIGLIWASSVLSVLPDLFIAVATEPPGFFLTRVFCKRDLVFRSGHTMAKRDASHVTLLVVVWLTLIYAYFNILFAARSAAADAKKARDTILLHGVQVLMSMMVYVQPMAMQVLIQAFPREAAMVNFVLFLLNQILPRLASPLLYGLRDKTFRGYLKKYILCGRHPGGPVKGS